MKNRYLLIVIALLLSACAQSPTGRNQLLLFGDGEMSSMGVAAFDDMKQKMPVDSSGANNRYVSCVADAITAVLPGGRGDVWEVVVFKDDSANAFALPGGKIGVHTGLLKIASTPDQLAAVIGHEVAHVIAKHSAERMSVQFVSDSTQQILATVVTDSPQKQTVMSLLGLGAQYGLILPYGRTQESESDRVGTELMARAGFDPVAAIDLWYSMAAASQGQPPEFMSTHPSHQTRIADLKAMMPAAQALYSDAKATGRRPRCQP